MSEYKLKSKRYGGGFRAFFFDWMILILFVALVIICCVSNAQFRTMNNIMNVLRQASFISIIAMGEFFVIPVSYTHLDVYKRQGYLYAALGLIAFLISKRHGLRNRPAQQSPKDV